MLMPNDLEIESHCEGDSHVMISISSKFSVRFLLLLIRYDNYNDDILIQILFLHILIYINHIFSEIFYVLFDFDLRSQHASQTWPRP